MDKLETGLYTVVRGCFDSKGNRWKEFDIVYISKFNHNGAYIQGEDVYIDPDNIRRNDTVVVSVDKYRDILFKRCKYGDYYNYVPESDLTFTLEDLRQFAKEYNDLVSVDELCDILPKYSKQYERIKESIMDDPFCKDEATAVYVTCLYWDKAGMEDSEDYEEKIAKAMEDTRQHLLDPYDISLYPLPLLYHMLNVFEYEPNLSMITGNQKDIDLYNDLLGVGVNMNIREAITQAAYHYYCGTPLNERDIDKAEPLLQRLVDEYNDEYAMNTLGYVYYYYRNDNKDHYKIAYTYFSMASLAGVIEATYKCADIFEKGLIGPKNPELSHKLLMDCYKDCVDDFYSGAIGCKFPDICLRIGVHLKNGLGVRKDEDIARAYLLVAKQAIEMRMTAMDYIGDESVLKRINKELSEVRKADREIIRLLPGSLLNAGLDVFYGYHDTYSDIKCATSVIDEHTLRLKVSSKLYKYVIFPDLIKDRARMTGRIVFEIGCSDAEALKSEIKKHSTIRFRDSTNSPELIVTHNRKEVCHIIRSFKLITE